MSKYLRTQLSILLASVLIISGLFTVDAVIAGPTQSPPDGNTTLPTGPQGPQGPAGGQGGQGPQGLKGPTGAKGPTGNRGDAICNYVGYGVFMSHGIDGNCAWQTGVLASCLSNGTMNFNRYVGAWPCTLAK